VPFSIKIAINNQEIVNVYGHNCGPQSGSWYDTLGKHIYRYKAENSKSGKETEGEVLHIRAEGMEKLAAIILEDLSEKVRLLK
jgi:hypothetical protein